MRAPHSPGSNQVCYDLKLMVQSPKIQLRGKVDMSFKSDETEGCYSLVSGTV